jgi:hypothetical protein
MFGRKGDAGGWVLVGGILVVLGFIVFHILSTQGPQYHMPHHP